jgi:hypothetical protein
VFDGRLSMFLSDDNTSSEHRSNMVRSIKNIMDKGVLNDSHPAMVNVTFIGIGTEGNIGIDIEANDDIGDNGGNTVEEIVSSGTPWIAIGAGSSILLFIAVATGYRYITSASRKMKDDDDDENLDDYDSVSNSNGEVSHHGNDGDHDVHV